MDQREIMTFPQTLIRFCAPALAGLKCANMVSCSNIEEMNRELDDAARELAVKNIFVRILYQDSSRMLVLVYRYSALTDRLKDRGCQEFLREFGYESFELEDVFDRLQMRIKADNGQFPHEIGVFLGYPLEDIRGFIENRGRNGLCCGEWKVYHEPEKAQKTFAKLKKCRDVYWRLFQNGRSVMQLTVPA